MLGKSQCQTQLHNSAQSLTKNWGENSALANNIAESDSKLTTNTAWRHNLHWLTTLLRQTQC